MPYRSLGGYLLASHGRGWVRSRASPCKMSGGQSGSGTACSPSTAVSCVNIIPPMFHTYLCLNTVHIRTTLAGIVGSNPTGSMDVCLLYSVCVVR
jgi:hypothetical protein